MKCSCPFSDRSSWSRCFLTALVSSNASKRELMRSPFGKGKTWRRDYGYELSPEGPTTNSVSERTPVVRWQFPEYFMLLVRLPCIQKPGVPGRHSSTSRSCQTQLVSDRNRQMHDPSCPNHWSAILTRETTSQQNHTPGETTGPSYSNCQGAGGELQTSRSPNQRERVRGGRQVETN